MKPIKKFAFAAGCVAFSMLSASALTAGKAMKIENISGAWHPMLSPDTKTLVFSTEDHTGLNCLDIESGDLTIVDDSKGAGFAPVFSADGKKVYYRTAALVDGLMNRDVRAYTIGDNDATAVQGMTRKDIDMHAQAGFTTYATAHYDHIDLTVNGVTKEIRPLAEKAHSYLWASLSPDGKRLVFNEPFSGVYIADADGSSPRKIAGRGDYPAWVSNSAIVYVDAHDDGYQTTEAVLKAYDVDEDITISVTQKDMIVSEVSAVRGKVAFATADGGLYLVNVQ